MVVVPEAGPNIEATRARLDSGARLGVPAHVTVLFPFMPADMINDVVLRELADLFAATPAFDVTFEDVGWFDDTVVFLSPRPEQPFRSLTEAVIQHWPEWPPYEGAFEDSVPHLTIGDNGDPLELQEAADSVAAGLPIPCRVSKVQLFTGTSKAGSWSARNQFPLS